MAAPTMPASFWRVAGTTRVRTFTMGRNLSDFLLTPPPMTISEGENSASTRWRYSSTRPAHLLQLSSPSARLRLP